MEIKFRPQVQSFVDEKLASGAFPSVEDLIDAALTLMEINERMAALDSPQITLDARSIAELQNDEGEPWDLKAIQQELIDSMQAKKAS